MDDQEEMMPLRGSGSGSGSLPVLPTRPSLQARLTNERQQLAARVALLDEAIEALEGNPEVSRLIEIVSRVTVF